MKTYATALMVALTLVMVGCGGDGGNGSKPIPIPNQAPSANNASFTTQADTELTGMLSAVDADGDALTFTVVNESANGEVVVDEDGSFTYLPNANYTGGDSFSFRVSDGDRESNVANVDIVIEPLAVTFSAYSRQAFGQMPTDEPLSLNSRTITQDVTDPGAYDDLLAQ